MPVSSALKWFNSVVEFMAGNVMSPRYLLFTSVSIIISSLSFAGTPSDEKLGWSISPDQFRKMGSSPTVDFVSLYESVAGKNATAPNARFWIDVNHSPPKDMKIEKYIGRDIEDKFTSVLRGCPWGSTPASEPLYGCKGSLRESWTAFQNQWAAILQRADKNNPIHSNFLRTYSRIHLTMTVHRERDSLRSILKPVTDSRRFEITSNAQGKIVNVDASDSMFEATWGFKGSR